MLSKKRLLFLSITCIGLAGVLLNNHDTHVTEARGADICATRLPPPLQPADTELVATLRDIGVQEDATKLDKVTAALQNLDYRVRMQALWALGRLGRAETLPQVQARAESAGPYRSSTELYEVPYARVIAAQIQAVQSGPARDISHLRQEMEALLQHAGLTAAQVDSTLENPDKADPDEATLARYISMQLADMALTASNHGVVNPAAVSPVNLSLSHAAKTKAELSAVHPKQRISLLVETLAKKRVIRGDDHAQIQLLVDEGMDAVPAIVAQLEIMRRNPEGYTNPGYAALFDALTGLGGGTARECVTGFLKDPDPWVRHFAQIAYNNLAGNHRKNRLIAY